MEPPLPQIQLVEGRDLQLAAGGRLQGVRQLCRVAVIEIQAGDGIAGLGLFRLFLDGKDLTLCVEFHDAVGTRILHGIAEDRRALRSGCGGTEQLLELRAVKHVVAQHKAARRAADEFLGDEESVRNAAGDRLHAVFHMDAKLGAVSQQAAVGLAVRRSRDEHDVADACHQQHAQRIIDHRLVIDRDQGFGNGAGHGVQAAALAASENDTFHPNVLPMMLNMICKPGYHGARTVVFPPGTYDTFAAGLPPASG